MQLTIRQDWLIGHVRAENGVMNNAMHPSAFLFVAPLIEESYWPIICSHTDSYESVHIERRAKSSRHWLMPTTVISSYKETW